MNSKEKLPTLKLASIVSVCTQKGEKEKNITGNNKKPSKYGKQWETYIEEGRIGTEEILHNIVNLSKNKEMA